MQPNINLKTKTSCTTIRLPPLPLLRKYTFACSLHKKTKTTLFFTQTQCPNETPDYLTETRQSLVSPHLILFERLMMRATKWKKKCQPPNSGRLSILSRLYFSENKAVLPSHKKCECIYVPLIRT